MNILILKGVRYRIKQEKETLLVCQMIDELEEKIEQLKSNL